MKVFGFWCIIIEHVGLAKRSAKVSSDLIFPILPRNTKVPVEGDDRVKKVAKSSSVETLNAEEKKQHEVVHAVDEKEQRHHYEQEKQHEKEQNREKPQNVTSLDTSSSASEDNDKSKESKSSKTLTRKHIDITI